MKYKKLQTASSITLTVSCILLFLETFGVAKTYVGGVLLGVGFLLQGMSQAKRAEEEDYDANNRPKIIFVIAAFIMLAGIVFIYMDLK